MSQIQGNKMKIQTEVHNSNKGNRCRSHTGGADYSWTVHDRSWTAGTPAAVMDHTRSEDYNHKNFHIVLEIFYFKKPKMISGVFVSTMKKLVQPSSAAPAACVSTSSHGCFQLDQENSVRVGGFPGLVGCTYGSFAL